MKKMILALAFVFALCTASAQVRFESCSTDALREKATKSNKLVFIDLYADWCGPCRRMEQTVFSRKEVGDYFDETFVAGKYNVDYATGRELLRKYGNGSIPLYLVFTTDGELVGRITGGSAAETFLAELRRIVAAQTRP